MSFKAEIIADSISQCNQRVTTFVCRYPRFIHSELMTHRVFSRNASSSRAIPVDKMIQAVIDDPAQPVFWGKNQAGMQAAEELDNMIPRHDAIFSVSGRPRELVRITDRQQAETLWLEARNAAVEQARRLQALGVHKQIVNRIIEPWAHITVVITATYWSNFFALRVHPAAQPEFQALARMMLQEYVKSVPVERKANEWHFPFIKDEERDVYCERMLLKLCVARCARVSYLNHEGTFDIQKDAALHDSLRTSGHMSPFEHPCQAMDGRPARIGNFYGWSQYRKHLDNEYIEAIDAQALLSK